jgi:acyl-CoA thioesterase I
MVRRPVRRPKWINGITACVLVIIAAAVLVWQLPAPKHVTVPGGERVPPVPAASVSASFSDPGTPGTYKLRVPSKRNLRVLFVGDSLSGSVFASTHDKGWVPQIVAELRRRGHTVEQMLPTKVTVTRGKSRGAAEIKALPDGADITFVEIGTNDVNHVPTPVFADEYRAMVHRIRRASPHTKLMCLGVWSVPAARQGTIDEYNGIIAQGCRGGTYFPLTDIWRNAGFHGPAGRATWDGAGDAFHPNDDGYHAIATRVRDHLRF